MANFVELFGETLLSKDGNVSTRVALADVKNVLVYFSAHWCPPCRGFTPQLAKAYKNSPSAGNDTMVIFASSDQDQVAFNSYYAEMPWHALPFDQRSIKDKLSEKFKVQGIPTLIILDDNGQLVSANGRAQYKKYLANPDGAGLDDVSRGQTEKFVRAMQKSIPAIICGALFLIAQGVAIGCLWLWASKETQPTTTVANATAIGNVTAATGDAAWSQWYLLQGIFVLVLQLLGGFTMLAKLLMGCCDEHVAKAGYYQTEGRDEEAADEAAEEGALVRMCVSCTDMLQSITLCLQCIPGCWCCVGLLMICFGSFSGFSMATVQSGWNENSKYYVLIQIAALVSGGIALCCFLCIGLTGGLAAVFSSGLLDDDNDVEE